MTQQSHMALELTEGLGLSQWEEDCSDKEEPSQHQAAELRPNCMVKREHELTNLEYHAQAAASAAPARTNFPGVPEGRPLGIITIEDVIEELLQQVCCLYWLLAAPLMQNNRPMLLQQ